MADCTKQFINYLVDQTPHFDKDIVKDINPTSGTWIGKVETRTWPSFMGNSHQFDRFTNVFPNPTREWTPKEYEACDGNPCDPTADEIGWGTVRQYYYKESRSIQTPLICFDQIRDVSHAKEHTAHIISDILRPASKTIMDYYLKKRSTLHAGTKWVADDGPPVMPSFTFSWVVVSDNEIYIDTNVDPTSMCKLAPQMLQRRVTPLTLKGYMESKVFESFPRLIELVTDIETVWDLDKQMNSSTGSQVLSAFWRYQDWQTQNNYWRYGFSGQLGNYAVSADPFPLRFNYLSNPSPGTYRYQLVLPYVNVDASSAAVYEGASFVSGSGLRMVENADFQNALYQFSVIHHRKAGILYVADAESVNPEMPFMSRNLAGEWKFANTELGCENIRQNKGKFYADFELAFKPEHPEWEEVIFHLREPACVPCVETCNDDPGYPTQTYNSANDLCEQGPWESASECTGETPWYLIESSVDDPAAVTIGGIPIAHDEIGPVATYAELATALNSDPVLSLLGTWEGSTDGLVLTNPTQNDVEVTIIPHASS